MVELAGELLIIVTKSNLKDGQPTHSVTTILMSTAVTGLVKIYVPSWTSDKLVTERVCLVPATSVKYDISKDFIDPLVPFPIITPSTLVGSSKEIPASTLEELVFETQP